MYSEELAGKVRAVIRKDSGWTEKRMFGGVAFMLYGNMCCGVVKDDLLVRVGADRNAEALSLPNSRPMDFTGKPIKGFIFVNSKCWSKAPILKKWIRMGIEYASSLPRK